MPPVKLWIHLTVTEHYLRRVPPFGYPWINAYLRLPMAFRSLSRPSSAISALASTLRSCSLDLASSMQTLCLLRLVGTDCSQSLFCLFLCSFQGAVKNLSILQNDTDYANHTSDSGPAAIYDLQNPRFSSNRLTSLRSLSHNRESSFLHSQLPRPWDTPSIFAFALHLQHFSLERR